MKILIQNGRVINPATGTDQQADVAIADGRILSIGPAPAGFAPDREPIEFGVVGELGSEVVHLDVDLAAEMHLASAHRVDERMVLHLKALAPLSQATEQYLERLEHGEAARNRLELLSREIRTRDPHS